MSSFAVMHRPLPLSPTLLPLLLAGCSHCPVCYQDAWSREPFPGQAKQHIAPVDADSIPDDVPAPGPLALPPDDRRTP